MKKIILLAFSIFLVFRNDNLGSHTCCCGETRPSCTTARRSVEDNL